MKQKLQLTLFLLSTMFANNIFAQLNYPVANCQNLPGTYTDLGTAGTAITVANNDDANSAALPIGFNFVYNGITFTQFIFNTNGFIKLGNVPPSTAAMFYATAQSNTGGLFNSTNPADDNTIAVFNHDLEGAAGVDFRYELSGTAPSRILTIQWKNVRDKTTTPAVQIANFSFQIKLFEGSNNIDLVYGTFTSSINASAFKNGAAGIRGTGNTAGNLIAITKGSVTTWDAATFLSGNYTGNAFNWGNNVNPGARPLPDPGRTYRFNASVANDLSVRQVYTLGRMAIPFGNPYMIKALISNTGTSAQSNVTVTLNVTGANTFTSTKTIASLAPNASSVVFFDNFSPANLGMNTVTVTLPSDGNNNNNTGVRSMETTTNAYSYNQGTVSAGGVGFTGATGDFVAKFKTNATQALNQVNVNFNAGGNNFKIGVWAQDPLTGRPGALLYETPQYLSTAGVYTVPINPAVNINGTFFVGVRQLGTNNVSFSYQNEDPIRDSSMYYTSPTGGTAWTDFATAPAPGAPFRFMVEPLFALANDVSTLSVTPTSGVFVPVNQPINFNATVINYGSNAQNNVPVYYRINNNPPVGPVFTTVNMTLNQTATATFSGANAYTPTTQGPFTVKFWTQSTGDQNILNDTLTLNYVAQQPVNQFPYAVDFTTPLQGWQITGTGNLWLATQGIQRNGANGPVFLADFFNVATNLSSNLVSPLISLTGITAPILKFDVAYRTFNAEQDTLEVLISTDGGATFSPGSPALFKKYPNNGLNTLPASTTQYTPAAGTEWRTETIDLSQFANTPLLRIAFKATSNSGNNLYVDNFEIYTLGSPAVTTINVNNITTTTATVDADVTSDGGQSVTGRGVVYSTSPNPTLSNNVVASGSGVGTFSANLTNLTPGTTYYVRAYATNSLGTSYGTELNFTTNATLATVTTIAATNITSTTAQVGGDITNTGGANVTERGIAYGNNSNPTINDNVVTSGTGSGTFNAQLTGLTGNTVYYARAYATNSAGTAYGQEIVFNTAPAVVPTVITNTATAITLSSADISGNISSDGGNAITATGFAYGTSQNPTVGGQTVSATPSGGAMNATISGLNAGTTYFVRAFATNNVGTGYGNNIEFNTLPSSINTNQSGSITIYAVNRQLFITGKDLQLNISDLKLIDLSGKTVFTHSQNISGNSGYFNLGNLASGIYVIQLQQNNEFLEQKILIP